MRALVAVIALALVATLTALDASSVSANALGEQIGATRRGQSYYESVMLQADRLVNRARPRPRRRQPRPPPREPQRQGRPSPVVSTSSRIVRSHAARVRVLERSCRPKARTSRTGSGGSWTSRSGSWTARSGTSRRLGRHDGRARRPSRRAAAAEPVSRASSGPRSVVSAPAEGALGGLIVSATRLAQQRRGAEDVRAPRDRGQLRLAVPRERHAGLRLHGLRREPVARVAAAISTTGSTSARRAGTRIGTVATGVIAYAGWNPWDAEGRAFIVVIGHADGYVSRYGHLCPIAGSREPGWSSTAARPSATWARPATAPVCISMSRSCAADPTIDPTSLFPDRGDGGKVSKDKKKGKGKAKAGKGKRKGGDARRTVAARATALARASAQRTAASATRVTRRPRRSDRRAA